MVGRKSSPLLPKKKTTLKGRGSARPKKAPTYEEDEEILDRPVRKPKEKKPVKRRGVAPSAPQQQLSTEDKKQIRRRSPSPEEQVIQLKVTIRTLSALLGTVLIAFGICLWLYFGGYLH